VVIGAILLLGGGTAATYGGRPGAASAFLPNRGAESGRLAVPRRA